MNCPECHHTPSGRFNAAGFQCFCDCHDVADAAPELLAAAKRALHLVEENNEEIVGMPGSFGLLADLKEAIAKAEDI